MNACGSPCRADVAALQLFWSSKSFRGDKQERIAGCIILAFKNAQMRGSRSPRLPVDAVSRSEAAHRLEGNTKPKFLPRKAWSRGNLQVAVTLDWRAPRRLLKLRSPGSRIASLARKVRSPGAESEMDLVSGLRLSQLAMYPAAHHIGQNRLDICSSALITFLLFLRMD
jgi:hypothetical protein